MVKQPIGCLCDHCDGYYTTDLMIPDYLWERIKPNWKPPGSGLLCPECIITSITRLLGEEYTAFELRRI